METQNDVCTSKPVQPHSKRTVANLKHISVVTNVYNKKTTGPTLMELFTTIQKLKKFFFWQLEMFDVCKTRDMAHIDVIQKFLPHDLAGTDHCSSEEYWCTHVDTCVARTWIMYQCVLCHLWCTHRTYPVVKKKIFQFSVAVNNSIKVHPLVFLLQIFVITENIMKCPV
jgi:hypothetical protein